jgi:hypothetical protein
MKTIQNSFKKKHGEKEKQAINTHNGFAVEIKYRGNLECA